MDLEFGLNDLPTEIKELILNKLSHAAQKIARTVCKEWLRILERNFSLKVALDDAHLEVFKEFDENRRIDELVVKNFQAVLINKSSTRSGLNKNIQCLVFGTGPGFPGETRRDPDSPYTVENWRVSRSYDNEYGISLANMKLLLEMNPGILGLRVSGMQCSAIPEQPSLKGLRLENLTVLDINFGNSRLLRPVHKSPKPSADPHTKLLQNFFPSLHTLYYSSMAWRADMRLWIALFQCIASHRGTLRKLKIFHTTVYSLQNKMENGKWFPQKKYDELRRNIREVKLDFLLLDLVKCGPNSGERWRTLERDLMEAQTSLVNFIFIGNARETVDFNYGLMFDSNCSTITSLEIFWHCLVQPPFDCTSLSQCTQLKSLKLNIQRTGHQQTNFDAFEKFYLNMDRLPTGIISLLCGQLVNDSDAIWISQNMLSLEEIGYACLRHIEETLRTLEHFLLYLCLPNLKSFRINNYKCQRIDQVVQDTPGLSMVNSRPSCTHVTIDRQIFKPVCYVTIPLDIHNIQFFERSNFKQSSTSSNQSVISFELIFQFGGKV